MGPKPTRPGIAACQKAELAETAPPSALKTRPPLRPTSQTLASAAAAQHPQAPACASLLREGEDDCRQGRECPKSEVLFIPSDSRFQPIPVSLFSFKQKGMPLCHFSKRQAPAKRGLLRSGEKQVAPALHAALRASPQDLPILTPRQQILRADPARPEGGTLSVAPFGHRSKLLTFPSEPPLFHQQ